MKRFGFFNSINGDRKYLATDISNAFNIALGSGLQPIKDCFKIVPHQNMKLKMKPGGAMIYGCYIFDDEDEVIELETVHSELNRIDRIVLRYDKFERSIKTVLIKGTPALNPTPPATLRTDNQFDLVLADLTVGKAVTEIKQENITDMRSSMLCGFLGMKMTPEIEKQLDSKASKSIYGDDGNLGINMLNAPSWKIARDDQNKNFHIWIKVSNKFFALYDDGTIYYNKKPIAQIHDNSLLSGGTWAIFRSDNDKYVGIFNKTTDKYFKLFDDGTITYGAKKVPVVQLPSFDNTVKVDPNQKLTVAHNLGYEPLIELSHVTLGNVNVTWRHKDKNTLELFNYQGTSKNEAYVRVRGW